MKFNSLIKATLTATMALTLALGIGGAKTDAVAHNPNANEQVVFYIPHQDDEALTFGVGILNHVRLGFDVHVVLLTDGGASGVRNRLGMTRPDFVAARNNEFLASLKLMGIKRENIKFLGHPDGKLTAKQMETVVRQYEKAYPGARHKTYSYTDGHPDHKNAGLGLQNANKAGVTDDARYYVRRGASAPTGSRLVRETYQPHFGPILQAVSNAYKVENPRLGLYGVGYKSVGASFRWLESTPSSHYHK